MPTSSRVPNFFRRIALKGWDNTPYFTFSSSYPVLRRWLLSQLSDRDKSILSIGCGSGELERDLVKLNRKVIGLDVCYEMLQAAQKRGIKNVVQADALNLPFVSSAFDLVFFPESIGYFVLDEVLPQIPRVLKKHGRLAITAYPPNFAADSNYRKFHVQELMDGLKRMGFRIAGKNLITVNRNRVKEVVSEADAQLIFVLAAKAAASRSRAIPES